MNRLERGGLTFLILLKVFEGVLEALGFLILGIGFGMAALYGYHGTATFFIVPGTVLVLLATFAKAVQPVPPEVPGGVDGGDSGVQR